MLFGRQPLSTASIVEKAPLWVPSGFPEQFDARDGSGPMYAADAREREIPLTEVPKKP